MSDYPYSGLQSYKWVADPIYAHEADLGWLSLASEGRFMLLESLPFASRIRSSAHQQAFFCVRPQNLSTRHDK